MTARLQTACLPVGEAIDTWGDAWRALADGVRSATLFMRPAAVAAWDRHYRGGMQGLVLVTHDGTRLVGVFPVMRGRVWRGPAFAPRVDYAADEASLAGPGRRPFPVRQVSSVVSWRASMVTPALLCHPEDRPAVCRALARALADLAGIDQIVLPTYEGEEAGDWSDGLSDAGLSPFMHALQRPVHRLETLRGVDSIVSEQSANFRKNFRRATTRAREAGVTFKHFAGRGEVVPRLGELAALADRSWKNTGTRKEVVALEHDARQQAYLRAVIEFDDPGLQPFLTLGRMGEQTVAAALWFRHGVTQSGLYIFRDEAYDRLSTGLLAMTEGYGPALAAGLRRIDLNSTQDWVRHVADTQQVMCNVIAFRPTVAGQLYRRIAERRGVLVPAAS